MNDSCSATVGLPACALNPMLVHMAPVHVRLTAPDEHAPDAFSIWMVVPLSQMSELILRKVLPTMRPMEPFPVGLPLAQKMRLLVDRSDLLLVLDGPVLDEVNTIHSDDRELALVRDEHVGRGSTIVTEDVHE